VKEAKTAEASVPHNVEYGVSLPTVLILSLPKRRKATQGRGKEDPEKKGCEGANPNPEHSLYPGPSLIHQVKPKTSVVEEAADSPTLCV